MIERIYTAEFASGYTAVMTVSLSGMNIVWSPKMPTITEARAVRLSAVFDAREGPSSGFGLNPLIKALE